MKSKKKKKRTRPPVQPPPSHKREYLAMAAITAICLFVFGRNITFDVFLIDVPEIIFKNPHIMTGLTWENIWWAFTQPNLALYEPLPNLVFMLESQLFGEWPGGYHMVTLFWHIACMCLFLWVMMRLTDNFAATFAATLILCIHPTQILTVSVIAPLHEIMQAFFMLLSIEAYRRYVKSGSYKTYACAVVFMGLGLLCKQIIVMLPAVLLLLDYWPLNRIEISFRNFKKTFLAAMMLIREKIPFFAMSLFGAFLAFYGKMQYGQIRYHVEKLTIPDAIYFIVTGYARYIGHIVYPLRLSYFEVYNEERLLYFFVISAVVLVAITAATFLYMWRRPYLIVGWLWFVFFLFPVSGVVRYMMESIALRYLYIPAMGLYLAIFVGITEVIRTQKPISTTEPIEVSENAHDRRLNWYWISVGISTSLVALIAFWQNGFFRNTETTALHMQKITGDRSTLAHNALGIVRIHEGRAEEAEEHFRRCVEIQPESPALRFYYGGVLYNRGKYGEVVEVMEPAVESVPDATEYLELYALGLMATGRYSEAGKYLKNALEIEPDIFSLIQNMAYCLILQGKYKEAQPYLEKGFKQDPKNPTLLQLKKMTNSVVDYTPN